MKLKGFVNINKEPNKTSSDVVVKVRYLLTKATGEKQKVGHLGTLDPLGTGVLPIAIGNATRLFDYSQEKIKTYETTFKFGLETNTLDKDGEVVDTTNKIPSLDEIKNVLNDLCGDVDQIPPQFSSKSVNGVRAYKLARKGLEVDLQPKRVKIYSITYNETVAENEYKFTISCSSGTYIRSICRDLAYKLDSLAIMTSINRIKSGPFEIANSLTITEFEKDPLKYLLPIDYMLKDYEEFSLPDDKKDKVLNGVLVNFENLPINTFVVKVDNDIVGLAENLNGSLHFLTRL